MHNILQIQCNSPHKYCHHCSTCMQVT